MIVCSVRDWLNNGYGMIMKLIPDLINTGQYLVKMDMVLVNQPFKDLMSR